MRRVTRYSAPGLTPLVSVAGNGRLEAALGSIMVGWALAPPSDDASDKRPTLEVEQGPDGWRCTGAGLDEAVTYADPVAAGCGVMAALFKAHSSADPEGLCLHAAGVRFGDGIVLLTGDYRAGKSLLTAACCAAGQQVFSDDIISLVPGRPVARAPGLALRLRLPLPERLNSATRRFIASHGVLESRRYVYVRPPGRLLAKQGAEAPVRALVCIDRSEDEPVRMGRIAPGDALSELIRRNFARALPARRIIEALDRFVGGLCCLRLHYGDAQDAVALMRRVFSGGAEIPVGVAGHAPPRNGRPAQPDGAIAIPLDTHIRRAEGVGMHARGEQAFLTDPEQRAIFHLNSTGTAVWRLLEELAQFRELLAVFATAFPDRPPERLSTELAGLIHGLAASGLVRIGGPSGLRASSARAVGRNPPR